MIQWHQVLAEAPGDRDELKRRASHLTAIAAKINVPNARLQSRLQSIKLECGFLKPNCNCEKQGNQQYDRNEIGPAGERCCVCERVAEKRCRSDVIGPSKRPQGEDKQRA